MWPASRRRLTAMTPLFQELDFRTTPMGDLSLRRRRILALDNLDVWEIKLGEAFLMSSLFTVVEEALAQLGLGGLAGDGLSVAVGGLGLGYTARAALQHGGVAELVVVDALAEVIEWHRTGLVPLGPELTGDPRCRFVHGDFFALVESGSLDPSTPERKFNAILLDIDHSPKSLLSPAHASFYSVEGLTRLREHLLPGGVFAMWSDDPPDEEFTGLLREIFVEVREHVVTFHNPVLERSSASTVYVSR